MVEFPLFHSVHEMYTSIHQDNTPLLRKELDHCKNLLQQTEKQLLETRQHKAEKVDSRIDNSSLKQYLKMLTSGNLKE